MGFLIFLGQGLALNWSRCGRFLQRRKTLVWDGYPLPSPRTNFTKKVAVFAGFLSKIGLFLGRFRPSTVSRGPREGGSNLQTGVLALFWACLPTWGLFEGFWRLRFAFCLRVRMVEFSGGGVFGAILGDLGLAPATKLVPFSYSKE